MDNCIFCKIIKGEIPSYKIYEDDRTIAFLDISKDLYGHTIIAPKHHYKNVLDCNKEDLNATIETIQKVSNHYVNNCCFDGINVFNSNEQSAEQVVLHLHFHIFPRKNNDGLELYPELKEQEINLKDIYDKLKIN